MDASSCTPQPQPTVPYLPQLPLPLDPPSLDSLLMPPPPPRPPPSPPDARRAGLKRDAQFPLAGLLREEGGIFAWLDNTKRLKTTYEN